VLVVKFVELLMFVDVRVFVILQVPFIVVLVKLVSLLTCKVPETIVFGTIERLDDDDSITGQFKASDIVRFDILQVPFIFVLVKFVALSTCSVPLIVVFGTIDKLDDDDSITGQFKASDIVRFDILQVPFIFVLVKLVSLLTCKVPETIVFGTIERLDDDDSITGQFKDSEIVRFDIEPDDKDN